MIKGLGLHNFSDKYPHETFQKLEDIKKSVEAVLYLQGYEIGFPLNYDSIGDRANIFAYSSPGEGGCVVRFGNETKAGEEAKKAGHPSSLYCCNKEGINNLVGAVLKFVGATGSLIQRTKQSFEKANFPCFEF